MRRWCVPGKVEPYIETFSGKKFTPLDPKVDDICLQDIAHSLSQQCRFSGHTREFYSVAEHSVRVAWLLNEWKCSPEVQMWGLLHDASEAYLQDVASPLKLSKEFTAYRRVEGAVMRAICTAFELPLEQPDAVSKADRVMLATEARDLMPFLPEHWANLTEAPCSYVIRPWAPIRARRAFIQTMVDIRFTMLGV